MRPAVLLRLARPLHTSARLALPRASPRARLTPASDASSSAAAFSEPHAAEPSGSTHSTAASSSTAQASTFPHDDELPWFLAAPPVAVPEAPPAPPAPASDLPPALDGLRAALQASPFSRLLTPQESTSREVLRFIHARAIDYESWCEWIVIVEVESASGGAVAGLARVAGDYLRQTPPPLRAPSPLDALGAPLKSRQEEKQDLRAPGVPRAAHSAGRDLEDWELRKAAQAEQGQWRPKRIISREAQNGLRALADSDPSWTSARLAEHFRISPEAVRRILRSRWEAPGAVVGRQNRRAQEREEERKESYKARQRESEEMETVWRALGDESAGSEADELEPQEELASDASPAKRFRQKVVYEGLVGPDIPAPRKSTPASRGDGEWCAVDADWCVVHVMTSKARRTWDVEGRWNPKKARDEPAVPELRTKATRRAGGRYNVAG